MNVIPLNELSGPCCALSACAGLKVCSVLIKENPSCDYTCPFYKPEGCRDWVRTEQNGCITLVPPEEYIARRMQLREKAPVWKVHWRSD